MKIKRLSRFVQVLREFDNFSGHKATLRELPVFPRVLSHFFNMFCGFEFTASFVIRVAALGQLY
jgi:hypothetical protein